MNFCLKVCLIKSHEFFKRHFNLAIFQKVALVTSMDEIECAKNKKDCLKLTKFHAKKDSGVGGGGHLIT